ncbi:MAG: hypothetical protein ACPGXY_05570 [Alphaproteobacteria bacterium]
MPVSEDIARPFINYLKNRGFHILIGKDEIDRVSIAYIQQALSVGTLLDDTAEAYVRDNGRFESKEFNSLADVYFLNESLFNPFKGDYRLTNDDPFSTEIIDRYGVDNCHRCVIGEVSGTCLYVTNAIKRVEGY